MLLHGLSSRVNDVHCGYLLPSLQGTSVPVRPNLVPKKGGRPEHSYSSVGHLCLRSVVSYDKEDSEP